MCGRHKLQAAVATLMGMGFNFSAAENAARTTGANADLAAQLLLDGGSHPSLCISFVYPWTLESVGASSVDMHHIRSLCGLSRSLWMQPLQESAGCICEQSFNACAGEYHEGGVTEVSVKEEVDALCAVADSLDLSTKDVEVEVLRCHGNHLKAMQVLTTASYAAQT